ncbi:hypothetical protein TSUD_151120 [Trifolium subterraneum]|uniref:Uncharacterized protein n=1 Tax=Trifolium subterraneum TaxID=3900 RepID=A0A2Z6MIS6_TRISU|nr:hypothetical protein TSUD_151120 [Trifolium subterraneum]
MLPSGGGGENDRRRQRLKGFTTPIRVLKVMWRVVLDSQHLVAPPPECSGFRAAARAFRVAMRNEKRPIFGIRRTLRARLFQL